MRPPIAEIVFILFLQRDPTYCLDPQLLSDDKDDERIRQHVLIGGTMAMPRGHQEYVVRFRVQGHRPGASLGVHILQNGELIR